MYRFATFLIGSFNDTRECLWGHCLKTAEISAFLVYSKTLCELAYVVLQYTHAGYWCHEAVCTLDRFVLKSGIFCKKRREFSSFFRDCVLE